jgi:hypothetical protein
MKIIDAQAPQFAASWQQLHEGAVWRHALYGERNLRFYAAYHRVEFTDRSVVVEIDDAVVAGLRITSHVDAEGVTVFSCFGQPSIYMEARGLGIGIRRSIHTALKERVAAMISQPASWRWDHAEHLDHGQLTEFGRHLLSLGGVPAISTMQVIDLSEAEDVLFSGLTKSFRWGVNWGRKNLSVRLLDHANVRLDDVDAFMELHIEAAGRETRTAETWHRQYEMILGKEAFACLGDLDGRLVTAALFSYSPDHCYYGVSASRRELFDNDKPLSHVLLWRAICHARQLRCRWFETGDLRFAYQVPRPSDKEISISTFKRNFGGRTFVRMRIALQAAGRRV